MNLRSDGFSMMEILVVIAIVAILATLAIPSYLDKIVNNFVSSVLVRNGAIDLTFGNRASGVVKGKVLTLRAAVVEDAPIVPVTWVCGYAKAPDKMTVNGADNPSIAARYLPLKCR